MFETKFALKFFLHKIYVKRCLLHIKCSITIYRKNKKKFGS